jgi:isopenicillin N synthase-like dioxygenase
MNELPLLDLSAFRTDPTSPAGRAFVRALRDACHGPGFCYLTGHGIAPTLDANVLGAARAFFSLPERERRRLAIVNSPHFRGYTILGDERTKGVSDWRDQLDLGHEEPAVPVGRGDPVWLRLRGPNQWPESLPGMAPAVLDWMAAMDTLGLTVLRALAVGLGQPIDCFDGAMLPRGDTHLKIIRYPAQAPGTDTGQGVGTHHDSGLVSLILQDQVGGLRVRLGDGFVEATPRPGTYVMNLGEMMQAATNGYLRATKHRVDSPPPGVERISIAYFVNPRFEASFPPLALPDELVAAASGGQNPDPDDPVFATFGDNYLKIRLRSHPDVAQAYYADELERRRERVAAGAPG